MRLIFLFASLVFVWPFTASAQMIEGVCKNLPQYRQQAGVEHVPGAEDVVPADLNAVEQPINAVEIPVTVDLETRFNLNVPNGIELEADMANIVVHPNGRVEYNGQDITDAAYQACLEAPVEETETPDGQPDGHMEEDAVNSEAKPEEAAKEAVEAVKDQELDIKEQDE